MSNMAAPTEFLLRRYDMNGRFQMQVGKNWILPKLINANRFFWDAHWLEIWSNQFCPSMGPNGGSVAMDSDIDNNCKWLYYQLWKRYCPSKNTFVMSNRRICIAYEKNIINTVQGVVSFRHNQHQAGSIWGKSRESPLPGVGPWPWCRSPPLGSQWARPLAPTPGPALTHTVGIGRMFIFNSRARIFKRLWRPGIASKEWIPPAYVAWRAGTITLFLLGS
jgi:hypothetical protein